MAVDLTALNNDYDLLLAFPLIEENIVATAKWFEGINPINGVSDGVKRWSTSGYVERYQGSTSSFIPLEWSKVVFGNSFGIVDDADIGLTISLDGSNQTLLDAANGLLLKVNGTDVIKAYASGFAGVNTANPAYAWDVTGDINFTGTLYNNGSAVSLVTQTYVDAADTNLQSQITTLGTTDTSLQNQINTLGTADAGLQTQINTLTDLTIRTTANFKGVWDSAVTYQTNEQVIYNSIRYYSLSNSNTNNNPATETTSWAVFVENVGAAQSWATARTISLGGDLTGNVSIDGTQDVTLEATLDSSGINLGTNTSGNYVESIATTTPIIGSASGEGATATIELADNYGDTKNPYGNKNKNLVLATHATDDNNPPAFRALVAADIPNIPASKVTGLPEVDLSNYLPLAGGNITGSLGIGISTPTPNRLLQVVSDNDTAGAIAAFGYSGHSSAFEVISNNSGLEWGFGTSNHRDLIFETDGTRRMTISGQNNTTLGNVGIGTTAPAYKLHVNGTSYFQNGFHFDGNEVSQTEKHSGGDTWYGLLKDSGGGAATFSYPTMTTKAGAHTLTFTAPDVTVDGLRYYLKFLHSDSEGGMRWTINDADQTPLHFNDVPGNQDDASKTWSTFDITEHVVTGTNTLYFWSTTTDGGYQYHTCVFSAVGLALPNEPVELQQHFFQGLTTDGNVGIGTTDPADVNKLEVHGNVLLNGVTEKFGDYTTNIVVAPGVGDAVSTRTFNAGDNKLWRISSSTISYNWYINVTNLALLIGEATNLTFVVETAQTVTGGVGTTHMPTGFRIDNVSQTVKWQNGNSPVRLSEFGTVGTAPVDVYSYTVFRTGSSDYTVLGNHVSFDV